MDLQEEGRHQKIGGFPDVDMAVNGASQMDGMQDEWRETGNAGRKMIPDSLIRSRYREKYLGPVMRKRWRTPTLERLELMVSP